MNKEWKETGVGNVILSGEGFHISFNPSPCNGIPGFSSDGGSSETALCYNNRFDILNGDFRKEYEEVFDQGLEACKEVYAKHKDDYDSSWTTD